MALLNKEARAEVGWVPYFWLCWLLFFVAAPAFEPFSLGRWALTAAATIVFLCLYFIGWRFRATSMRLWVVGAIAMLGVVLVPTLGYGGSVFFIYAAAFAGFCEGSSLAISILLVLEIIAGLVMWEFEPPLTPRLSIALLIAAVGIMNIQFAKRVATNRRLLRAQGEIASLAKIAERERIARDLHDVLGHTLSVIILKSELASRMASRDMGRAAREIREVEQIAREALSQVRSALVGYRRNSLKDEIVQARATLQTAGIELRTSSEPDDLPIGNAQQGALAMVVREAVTNILRHSKASECAIRLSEHDGICHLEISDNGCGGGAAEGQGIRGMRERLESLGGSLLRTPGPGTTLRITIPCGATDAKGN